AVEIAKTVCARLDGPRDIGRMGDTTFVSASRMSGTRAPDVHVLDVAGYTKEAKVGVLPRCNEWDMHCRTVAGSPYFLRINADTGELIAVQRWPCPHEWNEIPAQGESSDRGRTISHREAQLWARRYLERAGLALPANARLLRDRGYEFTFTH